MFNILAQTWVGILIISIIIVVFIVVTIINLKIKRPEIGETEECNSCANKSVCPIIIRQEKNNEENDK